MEGGTKINLLYKMKTWREFEGIVMNVSCSLWNLHLTKLYLINEVLDITNYVPAKVSVLKTSM